MNHDMLRRFAFIETRLLWCGGVTAGELAKGFGLARQNAQQSIKAYCQRHPGQMEYDRSRRRHVRTATFEAQYVQNNVSRFLDYQRAISQVAHFYEESEWCDIPFIDADTLIKPIYDSNGVQTVLEGLRQQAVVEIEYWSKTKTQTRLISPHHLVFADGRYHIRAYCHEALQYLDFVLTRVMTARLTKELWVSSDADKNWHLRKNLRFRINPNLPNSAQDAIRLDYIPTGENFLEFQGIRIALAYYIERRLCRKDWLFEIPLWEIIE
ncbi:WYL domain-containing protein [Allochromatium warmingii]|uniref:WYL domain-containing protein n=1 Tax=Allochromatium warmingii TaxID=61595 RepID=A0A1H3J1W0_ALLWA|nr:WYL domain-containing protein [Allochromatium warmingii]SDY33797.1 WYL domain-containing protein [Allochromatium warmingii]